MSAPIIWISTRLYQPLIYETVDYTFHRCNIHTGNPAKVILRTFLILIHAHKCRELSGCYAINSMILKDHTMTVTYQTQQVPDLIIQNII